MPSPQPGRGYGAANEHVRKIASRQLTGGCHQAIPIGPATYPAAGEQRQHCKGE